MYQRADPTTFLISQTSQWAIAQNQFILQLCASFCKEGNKVSVSCWSPRRRQQSNRATSQIHHVFQWMVELPFQTPMNPITSRSLVHRKMPYVATHVCKCLMLLWFPARNTWVSGVLSKSPKSCWASIRSRVEPLSELTPSTPESTKQIGSRPTMLRIEANEAQAFLIPATQNKPDSF